MDLLLIFGSSFMLALSGAMMPGPLLTVTIKDSLQHGWCIGFVITAGHALAEIILLVLFSLGLNHLVQSSWISAVVGVGGGFVLFYMGGTAVWDSLHERLQLQLAADGGGGGTAVVPAGTLWGPFKAGLVVSVTNPGWMIWWLSIGLLYVARAWQQGALGLGVFFAGHILADLLWFVLVSIAVATGARFISPAVYKWILALCGFFLLLLSVFFITQGLQATWKLI